MSMGRQPIRRFFDPTKMPEPLPNAPGTRSGWPEKGGQSSMPAIIRNVSDQPRPVSGGIKPR